MWFYRLRLCVAAEGMCNGVGDRMRVEDSLCVFVSHLSVVLEAVRQCQGPHNDTRFEQIVIHDMVQNLRAEATDCAFLDRYQAAVMLCELREQLFVKRLGEASIRDGARDALAREDRRRRERVM